MTSRILTTLRTIAAITAIITLTVVVPIMLLRAVGNPLPAGIPTATELTRAIRIGDVQPSTWIKAASWIAWLMWGQFTLGTIAEVPAMWSGRRSRTIGGLRAGQWAARRLLGSVTLSATLLTHTATAGSASAAEPPLEEVLIDFQQTEAGDLEEHVWVGDQADAPMPDAPPTGNGPSATDGRLLAVQRGDTLWGLAAIHLDDGERWPELRNANVGQRQPDGTTLEAGFTRIQPGWTLQLPQATTATEAFEAVVAEGEWTVEVGDHLWGISETVVAGGDESVVDYWRQLIDANRDRLPDPTNPDLIHPGTHLVLPARTADAAASETDEARHVTPSLTGDASVDQFVPEVTPATEQPAAATIDENDTSVTPAPAVAETAIADAPAVEHAAPETQSASVAPSAGWQTAMFGLAGTGVGAAALVVGLRELRRRQARRRIPGELPIDPPVAAAEVERKIRSIADHDAHSWVTGTNRYLAHQLSTIADSTMPDVIAIRAGTWGVELLLETPSQPIDGFVADNEVADVWRLNPTLELADLHAVEPGHPYSSALATVGTSSDGDILLDLERLAAISVRGLHLDVHAWYRSIITSLTAGPWAGQIDIVALDVELSERPDPRIAIPGDPEAWARAAIEQVRAQAARMTMSPYEERVRGGNVHPPTIVFVGPNQAELGQELAGLTQLAWNPFAVITTAPLAEGHAVVLTATEGTLEPAGLVFRPAYTPLQVADTIGSLVDAAEQLRGEAQAEPHSEGAAERVETDSASELDLTGPDPAPEHQKDQAQTGEVFHPSNESPAPERRAAEPVELGTPTVSFTPEVTERIREIMAPRPVEVRLLTALPTITGLEGSPTPKQQGIIGYLAYHRAVTGDRIRDVFWPDSTNRATCDNMLARIRKMLSTSDGVARLHYERSTSRHILHDDVGCDWQRVDQLLSLAKDLTGPDEVQALASAVGLIDGPVGLDAHRRHFSWLCDDHLVFAVIETALVDAAHRLGERALSVGDPDLARWAADKGLALVPGQEALLRVVMRACAAVGDRRGVGDAYRMAVASAEELALFDELAPETEELYTSLVLSVESNTHDNDGISVL